MAEQEKSEAFEYKGNTFHFRSGLKVEAPEAPFEVSSITSYEKSLKELQKYDWSAGILFLIALVSLAVMFLMGDFSLAGYALLAVCLAYAGGLVNGKQPTRAEHELKRLKEYGIKKERREAYEAWLKSKS